MTKSYNEICELLGMNPDIHFVKVTKKGISFTSGKPDEIELLLERVRYAKLTPAPGLLRTVRSIDPNNFYLDCCPEHVCDYLECGKLGHGENYDPKELLHA